jgi:hypothetical protein
MTATWFLLSLEVGDYVRVRGTSGNHSPT